MTSFYISEQIDIVPFGLKDQGGQNGGQKYKIISTHLLEILYVRPVSDSMLLQPLNFDLGGQ